MDPATAPLGFFNRDVDQVAKLRWRTLKTVSPEL